jgi:hypothetical protein
MPKSKSIRMLALIGLVLLVITGCSSRTKPAPGTSGNAVPSASSSSSSASTESSAAVEALPVNAVQPTKGTWVFDTAGVEEVPAGIVEFTLTNSDSLDHEARLILVKDGNVTAYRNALSTGGVNAVAGLGNEVAKLGPNDPGSTSSSTGTLEPGAYVIADFLPTSDGTVFAQHGMLRELRVIAG